MDNATVGINDFVRRQIKSSSSVDNIKLFDDSWFDSKLLNDYVNDGHLRVNFYGYDLCFFIDCHSNGNGKR